MLPEAVGSALIPEARSPSLTCKCAELFVQVCSGCFLVAAGLVRVDNLWHPHGSGVASASGTDSFQHHRACEPSALGGHRRNGHRARPVCKGAAES